MKTLFSLYLYLREKDQTARASYFRHRSVLSKACREFELAPWIHSPQALSAMKFLSQFAPLTNSRFLDKHLQIALHALPKDLPNERGFFRMTLNQLDLWKRWNEKTIEEFLFSSDAKQWAESRKHMKRKSFFELDRTYRGSKQSARNFEIQMKQFILAHPLLRLEDLKWLKIKNAQALYSRLPELVGARQEHLLKLRKHLS